MLRTSVVDPVNVVMTTEVPVRLVEFSSGDGDGTVALEETPVESDTPVDSDTPVP